jgi:hypothetical protein
LFNTLLGRAKKGRKEKEKGQKNTSGFATPIIFILGFYVFKVRFVGF